MARHESEMHRANRELISYLRELIDRKVIHWRDVPAHIRQHIVAGRTPCDHGLFSDDATQTDLIDSLQKRA